MWIILARCCEYCWFLKWKYVLITNFREKQNGHYFSDFEMDSLKFVPSSPINIPELAQIMDWRRSGAKPLTELMIISILKHTCFTWSQFVKRGTEQCKIIFRRKQTFAKHVFSYNFVYHIKKAIHYSWLTSKLAVAFHSILESNFRHFCPYWIMFLSSIVGSIKDGWTLGTRQEIDKGFGKDGMEPLITDQYICCIFKYILFCLEIKLLLLSGLLYDKIAIWDTFKKLFTYQSIIAKLCCIRLQNN